MSDPKHIRKKQTLSGLTRHVLTLEAKVQHLEEVIKTLVNNPVFQQHMTLLLDKLLNDRVAQQNLQQIQAIDKQADIVSKLFKQCSEENAFFKGMWEQVQEGDAEELKIVPTIHIKSDQGVWAKLNKPKDASDLVLEGGIVKYLKATVEAGVEIFFTKADNADEILNASPTSTLSANELDISFDLITEDYDDCDMRIVVTISDSAPGQPSIDIESLNKEDGNWESDVVSDVFEDIIFDKAKDLPSGTYYIKFINSTLE